jgi:SAM-dependent methyltransferase
VVSVQERLIHWVLRHYFPQARNFLEIGCGTGFVLLGIQNAFPGLSLSGSELFGEGLTYAHDRLPHVPLFQMDARRIPFEDEFDVIGAFDVLEHIQEDENVLFQMAQATKKEASSLRFRSTVFCGVTSIIFLITNDVIPGKN